LGKTVARIERIEDIDSLFESSKYVADPQITMSLFLALKLGKPLLVEGEPGCGKTEIAKVLSEGLGSKLIRLQCYEGLDVNSAAYEWDYIRQLLAIRIEEQRNTPTEDLEQRIFSERFLLKRPLLEAVLSDGAVPPVLLIDEIDRADEEFEGFLLELLAEFQVTIPELGTFKAKQKPIIIITSNHTRELGDGLRRRCLYLYISYPDFEKELKIVKLKVPGIDEKLARDVVTAVERIRSMDEVVRKPGTSETLDWTEALKTLGETKLTEKNARNTLSCVLKNSEELSLVSGERLRDVLRKE
jgi:MoxR-like ATPase